MDFKKEIQNLRVRLSGISTSLSAIIRGMRPQNTLKQELVAIEEVINKSTSKLEEMEQELNDK